MKVYCNAGTAIEFAKSGDEMVSFQGAPISMIKRMSASNQLTGKGVRRILLRTVVPFVVTVDNMSGNPLTYKDVGVHTVLDLPFNEGLQNVDVKIGGPDIAGSLHEALVQALSLHLTALTGKSVQLAKADIDAETGVLFRGSNGVEPLLETASFGSVTP